MREHKWILGTLRNDFCDMSNALCFEIRPSQHVMSREVRVQDKNLDSKGKKNIRQIFEINLP
jgi:hypothetical protein